MISKQHALEYGYNCLTFTSQFFGLFAGWILFMSVMMKLGFYNPEGLAFHKDIYKMNNGGCPSFSRWQEIDHLTHLHMSEEAIEWMNTTLVANGCISL